VLARSLGIWASCEVLCCSATNPACREPCFRIFPSRLPSGVSAFLFEGRGSGVDPDAYVQEERGTPLNEFFPTFPVDAALAQLQRGHTSEAQALGVSQIVVRPYLHSNIDSLRYQFVGIKAGAFSPKLRSSARLVALPLLGILAHPAREATLADRADENAVFSVIVRPVPSLAFAFQGDE
jgi:hypothetical protein